MSQQSAESYASNTALGKTFWRMQTLRFAQDTAGQLHGFDFSLGETVAREHLSS
jgi:hypothetical protein